jgi:hypothetical protein
MKLLNQVVIDHGFDILIYEEQFIQTVKGGINGKYKNSEENNKKDS